MTKKDRVLWVVLDRYNQPWMTPTTSRTRANKIVKQDTREWPDYAPFRVVKYLPAPKKRKNRK